jgi:predicted transcriptional regulator
MKYFSLNNLSKRERQIIDIIYQLGEATAEEVIENFPEKVADASLRKLIRIMEKKGYLRHRRKGHAYIYSPTASRDKVRHQAIKQVLKTFFQDSTPNVVSTLLDIESRNISREDLDKITSIINKARKKGM